MSLADYFVNKCLKNLEEDVALILAKLADPSSIITVDASGALVDAAAGGLGSLAAFAGDYIKNNADTLVMETAGALGFDDEIANALNLAYNLIALATMLQNDLLLMFLKKVAANAIVEIDKKDEKLDTLKEKLQALYNALVKLASGDPVWNDYVEQLRQALTLLAKSKSDLQMVRSTLFSTDYFLGLTFVSAKDALNQAKALLVPLEDNPYLEPSWKGLLKNLGLPTAPEQIAAIMAIPVLSKEVAKAAQGYMEVNLTLSALLDAFMAGYDQLQAGMPKLIKKYVLSLLDANLKRLGELTRSMATKLNGSEDAIGWRTEGFEPQPLTVSVLTYKWAMDLSLIISSLKLVPESQLNALNVAAGAVAFYKSIVDQLRAMDGIAVENAVLIQEDAKESTGSFESQLMMFLIEANTAIVSSTVRQEIVSLGNSMLVRIDLSKNADAQIKTLLQSFIDYKLPDQELLDQIAGGIFKMLGDLGLDNAKALLESGNFAEFLNLNGNTATLVGAALAILALLKNCFKGKTDDQLDEIISDLQAEKDLLNISFSINFDLAIFNNLAECLKLNGFAAVFDLQELFCNLVNKNKNVGAALKKFTDFVSF